MPSSSSSCRPSPVALESFEVSSALTASVRSSPRPRVRRPRRVLYPASQSRRAPLREEAPDQALRWLLLLSVLVFLQIYTEETHTCAEIRTQVPDPAGCPPQEGEGSLDSTAEEAWRLQTVVGASEPQRECVVA